MSERGYGSVLALMLLFGGVLVIGLAVDLTRLIATWREAAHLANTAAEVGAGWVQPDELYRGRLVVDVAAASEAAHKIAAGSNRSVRVEASSSSVCVTIQQEVAPGITALTGAAQELVSVAACASPRQG